MEKLSRQIQDNDQECAGMTELIKEKEDRITDLDVQLVGARIETQHLKEEAEKQEEEVKKLKKEIKEVEESLRNQLKEEEDPIRRLQEGMLTKLLTWRRGKSV